MKKLVVAILGRSALGAALFALILAPIASAASPMVAHPPADFAGTGRSALIWHNTNGAAALWLMNGTTQTSAAQFGPYTGWSVVSGACDFNGDGKSDLLWSNVNGAAAVWLMNGTSQTSAVVFGPFTGWSAVSGNHDFNGDGKSDLLWKNTDGSVAIWLMDGTTVLSQASFGPYTGWSIVSGNNDFNGDGKSDLLWKNSNGAAALWLMDGTTQTSATQFGPYTGWSIVSGSSDYDGDGKTDLLWQNSNGAAALWLMNGLTQTSAAQFGPYTGWTVVPGRRDFNGDGKSDLLWSNSNGAAAVWLMNGLTQTSAASFGPFTGWSITGGMGDYNGDGMTDLLWSNTDGSAAVWLMNGTTQTSAASFGPYLGWSIITGDATSSLRISVAGGGTVAVDDVATACTNAGGAHCSVALNSGSHQLTATPDSGYAFTGWYSNTTTAGIGVSSTTANPYSFAKTIASQNVTAIFTPTATTMTPPNQIYTDIISGPLTGGENNKGMYLSVFGKNFGTSGIGTRVKMYLNNMEVDNYRLLQLSRGRTDIYQVTAQLGALGAAVNGTAIPVVVVVDGRIASDPNGLAFTPNPGHIYFVSLSGNNSTGQADDIAHPYRHVQITSANNGDTANHTCPYGAVMAPATTEGAWGLVVPGDVMVMRGGTWTDHGRDGFFLRIQDKSGSAPTGATGTGPITIMGYPGETAYINQTVPAPASEDASSRDGISGGIGSADSARQEYGCGAWVTIANLKIESGYDEATIATEAGYLNPNGGHWRVVNNELSAASAANNYGAKGAGVSGSGTGEYYLGNDIHDVYCGENCTAQTCGANNVDSQLQNHGFYIDGAGSYEVAYNRIINIHGGNGIQSYTTTKTNITNMLVHHNLIDGVGKHGLNVADGSGAGFVYYNNIVMNTTYSGLRFNTQDLSGAKFYNNTFYNANSSGSEVYGVIQNTWGDFTSGAMDVKNNIFIGASASVLYQGGQAFVSDNFSNNLWYNGSGASLGGNKQMGNPLFVSTTSGAEDLHLRAGSPAIDTGSSIVLVPLTPGGSATMAVSSDFDVTPSRPQGSGFDIGAYEYQP